MTFGGLSAFRGAALLFASGGPISGFGADFTWWGQGKVGARAGARDHFSRVRRPCLRRVALHRSAGTSTRSANPEAARLAGLNIRRITLSVYVIIGFFAGLAVFVLSARLDSAEAVAGLGYELTVIASVVIGGTSLFGGIGSVFGTVDRLDPDRYPDQRPRADERASTSSKSSSA